MMHQPIQPPSASRWCILRTSGGKTLGLAKSLTNAGIDAWTPRRTFKRLKPGRCEMIDGRKPTVEIDAPILPTFVFARATHLNELVLLANDPASQHPDFSVFLHAGRAPEIADREVEGLRKEERRESEVLQRLREAESRAEKRRIRAAAANTERERRKLLRAEIRQFDEGLEVTVTDMPGFIGRTGIVLSSDGRSAIVAFGGLLTAKVEAWQVVADPVHGPSSVDTAAE